MLTRRSVVKGVFFHLYTMPGGSGCARLGLIVGKKVEPRAVYRNFAKRLVREAFRRADLPGLDIVVRLCRRLGREDSPAARAELERLMAEVAQCRGS